MNFFRNSIKDIWYNFLNNLTLTQMVIMSTLESIIGLILIPKLVLIITVSIVLIGLHAQKVS